MSRLEEIKARYGWCERCANHDPRDRRDHGHLRSQTEIDALWLVERVERLERWKAEALEVMSGLQELGKALGLGLGVQITGPAALAEVARLTAERDALAAQVARLAKPGDPDARMDAYYYGFTRTGVGLVDDILSAVAKAGKSFHGTDMWNEELYDGGTCESRIQDAADAAAEQIRAALAGSEAGTSDTQPTDQEDQS